MTPQEVKEQLIKMESWADGFKSGVNSYAKWVIDTMSSEEEAKLKAKQ